MNNPFDFFDKIYCINLPQSKDRWNTVSKEFKKVEILDRVERIWATPPDKNFKISSLRLPTMFGCGLSHLKTLMYSMHENVDNVLIFEDDVVFADNSIEKIKNSLKELPNNWDILFLGGNPRAKLIPITNNLRKTNGEFLGAFAYSVSRKGIIQLCNLYIDAIVKTNLQGTFDNITSALLKKNNGYIITPYACTTNPCISVINNTYIDFKTSQDEHWEIYR